MTSLKQIEANRRNAENSTGPRSEAGKQRSSRNAVRHGLTAETVIEPLEDAEDYAAFEEAIAASFDPETAVERELILRLASLLWRLRRATSIETALFQVKIEHDSGPQPVSELSPRLRPAWSAFTWRQPVSGPPMTLASFQPILCGCGCKRTELPWRGAFCA